MKSKGITQRIENARLLINGAINQPAVGQELAKVGFPAKEIQKGKSILDNVMRLQSTKSARYGSRFSAAERFKQDQATAWAKYMYHIKSAKLVFQDDIGTQRKLQLNVPRERKLAEWMEQARYFYQEIEQMPEAFTAMGVTAEELARVQAMIEAIGEAKLTFKGLGGEAQQATQERDIAMKSLDAWVSKFTKAARLALDEQDQLLEGMGLLVRSK